MAPPPKLRRRPLLWALGIALIALGALGAGYVATAVSNTQSVLALRADVDRGQLIGAEDLIVAQVSVDPALDPVGADAQNSVIGQRATRDLNAGSLLTGDSYADQVIPASGESLVGVALTPAQLPAGGVRPGETVRIINTPREQDELPKTAPTTITATVVALRENGDLGTLVVDVTVPTDVATDLASLVATGRVALVVDGVGDDVGIEASTEGQE